MNGNGSREQVEVNKLNVVSLFRETSNEEVIMNDPLTELLIEAGEAEEILERPQIRTARVVNENLFPDQSMYVLDEQIANLRSSLNRIKFYLGEIEEILPR
jgi:hypothetical protein